MSSQTGDNSREHSYICEAAIKELASKHKEYKEKLWASTSGKVVGEIQHSPKGAWDQLNDPGDGHSDHVPEAMANLLKETEVWCDFLSLVPPDGMFLKKIKEALASLDDKSNKNSGNKIIVRFLFGFDPKPPNCNALIEDFTEGLSSENLEIWIGGWRKDISWNHSKIVAVDGKYVYTGGHNMWSDDYLKEDPVHDTSIQLEGPVAIQAHQFANDHWEYIKEKQSTSKGAIIDKIDDGKLLPIRSRVLISEWPKGASTFAPVFEKSILPNENKTQNNGQGVKILTLGRYGKMNEKVLESSDDAFVAMFDAAQNSIRFLLQDIGPMYKIFAGGRGKIIYKDWPTNYLKAWARAMYDRGVDIEIVLSNPGVKNGYSHGWSCEEVAAEIIKTMREEYPEASQEQLKKNVVENLRICFIKNLNGSSWESENKVSLHSKFFIIDELCYYVGSQNIYQFDNAEWGVVIDNKEKTEEVLKSLWNPAWEHSYKDGGDCVAETVMDILGVDRGRNVPDSEPEIAHKTFDVKKVKGSKFFLDEDV